MGLVTLIIPYYRAPLMLAKQLKTVRGYPRGYSVIIVDDCSPESAESVVTAQDHVSLYRIDTDIPWNREGARNLGAMEATTPWIIHMDTDHVLPVPCAKLLLQTLDSLDMRRWYRFPRYRVGRADETRRKDAIPDAQEYGPVKPHRDSYLITRNLYWRAGGYNENYSGCLGGGGPFLKQLALVGDDPGLLPPDIYLQVYTRDRIPDASVSDLSRDKAEFKRRRKLYGITKAKNPLRFKWHKVK